MGKSLTEDERRYFESLESLRLAAYTSFSDRRVYEWKVNLAIWAALGVIIVGLLQPLKGGEPFPLQGWHSWAGGLIFGAIIVFLHGYWLYGAARKNAIDKGVSEHYMELMEKMVDEDKEYNPRLQDLIDHRVANRLEGLFMSWSTPAVVSITAVLAMATVVILFLRDAPLVPLSTK